MWSSIARSIDSRAIRREYIVVVTGVLFSRVRTKLCGWRSNALRTDKQQRHDNIPIVLYHPQYPRPPLRREDFVAIPIAYILRPSEVECIRRHPEDGILIICTQEIHRHHLWVYIGSNIQKGANNLGIASASEKVQRALASLVIALVSWRFLSQTFGPLNLSCES